MPPDHFSAGDAELDFQSRDPTFTDFFRTKASVVEASGFGRVFLLKAESTEDPPVLGFYAICMARIAKPDLPPEQREGAPAEQMPVALLAQFGKDRRVSAARDVANEMMADMIQRVLVVAEEIGCAGIILDTREPKLVLRYEKFGFRKVGHNPSKEKPNQKMFLPIQHAQANVPKNQ